MFFTKEIRELIIDETEKRKNELAITWKEIENLKDKINSKSGGLDSIEFTRLKSRVDDIEIWKAKIHTLLTTTTINGTEKLNKTGKFIALGYQK